VVGEKKNALAQLWNAIVGSVEGRVSARVPERFKIATDVLYDIFASLVEHIRNVFKDNRQWLENLHKPHHPGVETAPTIMEECVWVICDLAELGPSDSSVRLAGWTGQNHVHRFAPSVLAQT
jgi:hypothetical protein